MGMDLNPRIGYFINQELSKDSLKRMGRLICDQWHALQTILNYTCLCPITWKVPIGPHPSIFCTVQAKSNDQLHLFEKQKQDITIDNYVHRRLGLIKENSDYSWSTNLICHCFPLLSTSFANLKHGRTTEKIYIDQKVKQGEPKTDQVIWLFSYIHHALTWHQDSVLGILYENPPLQTKILLS